MTDKQINAAIAEACGWTDIRNSGVWHNFALWGLPPQVKSLKETSSDYIPVPNFVPNYCADLNAMHEAEKTLTIEQWHDYVDFMPSQWECAVHATARQRAKAFLRTLGKWEEAK
jgi:hypothetical protein